ncbi:gypsy type transposase [Tanacetum coccineum]
MFLVARLKCVGIVKIDFEKAYDSVRWDYLDDVLRKFGFGEKWCGWIQECLRSSWGSVLVNGSPTEEFQFFKGLKQGLSINLRKSKLLGGVVSEDRVVQAANRIGCGVLKAPFAYLGSKVGGNMSRIKSWDEIVDKMVDHNFACPAFFPWHTVKQVTRDPAPVAADFNAQDYTTLVTHPSPFWKFPEEFMCLVGLSRHYTLDEETYPWFLLRTERVEMDLFAFIHTTDPTKVKVVEREQVEYEPLLLHTTVGRIVPLLPVAPDRAESKLEASVDRLFEEGGSGNQTEHGDSAGGGGQGVNIQPVIKAADATVRDLREDHGTPSGPLVAGKSRSAVKRLLAEAVLNADVRGEHIPTLPFVTSSVSAMPEREGGDHIELAEVNSLVGSSVPVMTAVTTTTSIADPAVVVKKTAKPSLFSADSSSAGGTDPNAGVFSDLTGSDFLVSGVCTVIDPDTDLQEVYMSLSTEVRIRVEYNIKEKRMLKSVVDEKNKLLKIREKEDEVKALKEHNISLEKDRDALDVKVRGLEASAMGKDRELTDLNAQLTSVKSHNDNLVNQVHELKVSSSRLREKLSNYENLTERLEEFQDAQLKIVNDKFDKLYADFVEMALHLEEKFYPYLLTTIFGRRWLLTHGMELAISKCLNSPGYLSALGAAIGKGIEKGMQDELSIRITHGMEGRVLTDVAAYNPSAEADYISALQRLQSVNFSLLVELRFNFNIMDATIDTTMALSTTLASAGTVAPISVDNYEVIGTDDQAVVDENATGNAEPFPSVDDVKLNIP